MTFRLLQIFTVLLPTLLIGGFEYVRHEFLMPYMSMETGNLVITLLTFVIFFNFSLWIFHTIRNMNERLAEERAKRAVYEERERLARELHDGIAQSLFYLNVTLKKGNLDEARKVVSTMDSHVRQSIFNLRTSPEEANTFRERVERWLSQWSTLSGIAVTHDVSVPDGFFPPRSEMQLFGVIQEAFNNIQKHAGAQHAYIHLHTRTPRFWELTIQDDGVGIDTHCNTADKHYGLKIMSERAEQINASFWIGKSDQGGTVVKLTSLQGGKGNESIPRPDR